MRGNMNAKWSNLIIPQLEATVLDTEYRQRRQRTHKIQRNVRL
jgi:hypothetical protein